MELNKIICEEVSEQIKHKLKYLKLINITCDDLSVDPKTRLKICGDIMRVIEPIKHNVPRRIYEPTTNPRKR